MNSIKINNTTIGNDEKCYIIAEIGINHNGDINIAKQLIVAAKEAGCDAVKFQKRTVDIVYTREELLKPRENPFGKTNGDLKRGLEFTKENYNEIDKYCKEINIDWFASPWDEASVDFLEQFNVPCYKIASASLTDDGLLKHIKSKNKPVILSIGMSNEQEVQHAIDILGEDNLVLLHTVSTYPAKIENIHLNVINTLKSKYKNTPIGYSGHEEILLPSIAAVAMGACIVERHITLDKNMWGSDQKASIEPKELKELIDNIRVVEKAKGIGIIQCVEAEISVKEKLRRK